VADTPDKEAQADQQPEAILPVVSSRVPAILVSLSALAIIGAATANSLPNFNRFSWPNFSQFALPNFSRFTLPSFDRFAAPPPHETASVPKSDPAVTAALRDIQSSQQQNAAVLVSLAQSSESQQADLKRISRQLSLVTVQLNSLQSATAPLTTSSIPLLSPRARVVGTSRRIIPALPKPVGPVSVGGAPLSPAPLLPGPRAG